MMWCDGRSDVLETSNHLKIESIACRNDSQFRFQSIAVFFCRKGTSSTCSNQSDLNARDIVMMLF